MEQQNLTKKQKRELKKQEKLQSMQAIARREKAKSIVAWFFVLIILAAIVWAVIGFGGDKNNQNMTPSEIVNSRFDDSHIKGNPDAAVSLVEYSDFQCQACAYYKSFLNDIVNDLGDKVSVEYRHFPLRQIHSNSALAAQAAEAAALQGKFWEMHDLLFERQSEWEGFSSGKARDEFVSYAKEINLDQDKFVQDIDSDFVKDKVKQDEMQAYQIGLNSTPSIFVNGIKITNPGNYADFRKIVESEVNWN